MAIFWIWFRISDILISTGETVGETRKSFGLIHREKRGHPRNRYRAQAVRQAHRRRDACVTSGRLGKGTEPGAVP